MTDKIENTHEFEILERVSVYDTNRRLFFIIKALCKNTSEIVWVTGDDQVCAVTREDFLRNKLDYNSVLIQEFPLGEHNPENVGRWKPIIRDFIENMLTAYMNRDGFARVYPQWLPEHAYAHYGKEMFDIMRRGCNHIILNKYPQIMEFVYAHGGKKTMEQADMTDSPTSQAINGKINCGDYVIAADNNEYAYLVGEVIEIIKHGTAEYVDETDNDTDSVHVNFKAFNYPPNEQINIVEYFTALSCQSEPMQYDDLPLGDVIMAPDMLIRITDLGADKINNLVNDFEEAKSFCDGFIANNDNE